MAFFLSPGQFTRRAEFYHQLAQLTTVGLGLVRALEHLEAHAPAHSYREPLRAILSHLEQGQTFGDALEQVEWLSPLEVALLQAGEQSGRLDSAFRTLADYYTERAKMVQTLIREMLYPLFLLHFFVFIVPFPSFFLTGDWSAYLTKILGILLPAYGVVALLFYLGQASRGQGWRSVLEQLLHYVPVVGSARQQLALARLAGALEALLSAGVTIREAWEMAAAASGSPALKRIVLSWRPDLDAGQTPAQVVADCGWFPELFCSQYRAGEMSGRLEESLQRLSRYYQEEGQGKVHLLAQWIPKIVYLGICLAIAYYIVNFYKNYFGSALGVGQDSLF